MNAESTGSVGHARHTAIEAIQELRAELGRMALPDNAWRLSEVSSAGRWIVYMGRYDNAAQVSAKKAELRELGVDFRDVNTTGLAPGLSLGTFSSEAAAQTALQQVVQPAMQGLGDKLGVLVFQISPLPSSWLARRDALLDRLDTLLGALPRDLLAAVPAPETM